MKGKKPFSLKPSGAGHTHPAAEQLAAKTGKKKQARLNVTLNEDLYRTFKLAAMKQGQTVTASVLQHIHNVIAKDE